MLLSSFQKNEVHRLYHRLINFKHRPLRGEEKKHLFELKWRGWTVLKDKISPSEIQSLPNEIDQLLIKYSHRTWKDTDGADMRLFGINKVTDSCNMFHTCAKANKILEAYTGIDITQTITMAGRIDGSKINSGSGGGWHRDAADHNQVKSIMYLSQVDINNGPFEFIDGSHKRSLVPKIAHYLGKPWDSRRFSNEEMERVEKNFNLKRSTILAPPGHILLVDTSGLHRGKPLLSGKRYALTNYIWNKLPVPQHIKDLAVGS